MFGESISESPRMPSPWDARRLSSSVNSSGSTGARTSTSVSSPPLIASPPHAPVVPSSLGTCAPRSLGARASRSSFSPDRRMPDSPAEDTSGEYAAIVSSDQDEEDGFFALDMDVDLGQVFAGPSTAPHTTTRELAPHTEPNTRTASLRESSPIPRVATASPSLASPSVSSTPATWGPIVPETDRRGNVEYKLWLLPPSRQRFSRLVTQAKWRLLQGGGLAFYEVGVLDDGALVGLSRNDMRDSLWCLAQMAKDLGCTMSVKRVIVLDAEPGDAAERSAAVPVTNHRRRVRPEKVCPAPASAARSLTSLNLADAEALLGPGPFEFDLIEDEALEDDQPVTQIHDADPQTDTASSSSPADITSSDGDGDGDAGDSASSEDEDGFGGFGFSLSLDDYATVEKEPAALSEPEMPAGVARRFRDREQNAALSDASRSGSGSGSGTSSAPVTPPFGPELLVPHGKTLGDGSHVVKVTVVEDDSSLDRSIVSLPAVVAPAKAGAPAVVDAHAAVHSPFALLDVEGIKAHGSDRSTPVSVARKACKRRSNAERRARRLAELRAAEMAGAGLMPEIHLEMGRPGRRTQDWEWACAQGAADEENAADSQTEEDQQDEGAPLEQRPWPSSRTPRPLPALDEAAARSLFASSPEPGSSAGAGVTGPRAQADKDTQPRSWIRELAALQLLTPAELRELGRAYLGKAAEDGTGEAEAEPEGPLHVVAGHDGASEPQTAAPTTTTKNRGAHRQRAHSPGRKARQDDKRARQDARRNERYGLRSNVAAIADASHLVPAAVTPAAIPRLTIAGEPPDQRARALQIPSNVLPDGARLIVEAQLLRSLVGTEAYIDFEAVC